jgi:hypothetical protein
MPEITTSAPGFQADQAVNLVKGSALLPELCHATSLPVEISFEAVFLKNLQENLYRRTKISSVIGQAFDPSQPLVGSQQAK